MTAAAAASRGASPRPRGIGNGRVIALVSPTSAIEWLCLPRSTRRRSSRACSTRTRAARSGCSRAIARCAGNLRYLANTNVLSSRFERDGAAWEVIDFAPRIPKGSRCACRSRSCASWARSAATRARVDFDPRPDYGARRRDARDDARPRGARREPRRSTSPRTCRCRTSSRSASSCSRADLLRPHVRRARRPAHDGQRASTSSS